MCFPEDSVCRGHVTWGNLRLPVIGVGAGQGSGHITRVKNVLCNSRAKEKHQCAEQS